MRNTKSYISVISIVIFMFNNRKRLPVFHEDNIEEILKRFKLSQKFENNELKCAICESIVSKNNFGCLFLSKDGTVKVACSNPECLEKVYEMI
jgi:hypothetical protein